MPLYLLGDAVARWGGEPVASFYTRTYPEGFGGDPRIFFATLLNALVTALTAVVLASTLAGRSVFAVLAGLGAYVLLSGLGFLHQTRATMIPG